MNLADYMRHTDSFGDCIDRARSHGKLVVQPRMGFSSLTEMRHGLQDVKAARATAVGTITLDSYTRVGDNEAARAALAAGSSLNGYPLLVHGADATRSMLEDIQDARFPVQVRHGSPLPQRIFRTLIDAGIDATEGGPISYCLPYGRTPLAASVADWSTSCQLLSDQQERGQSIHLESFGGCMLGQLCPPSLLVAIGILEGLFFRQHGLTSISLSYAQQTNHDQDLEAIRAQRTLAAEFLHDTRWHTVLYTYMGVYPQTPMGAVDLLQESAILAVRSGAERLIVKTRAEAERIPTVAENIEALELASAAADEARHLGRSPSSQIADTGVEAEARALIQAVLDLDGNVAHAMVKAFERGYLDIPYCLHADNAGRARSYITPEGRLAWSAIGAMPLAESVQVRGDRDVSASEFLAMLSYVKRSFDEPELSQRRRRYLTGHAV